MLFEQGLAILSTLLTLAIPILLIVLLVRAVRSRTGTQGTTEASGTLVRRLFQYALMFAALMISAFGIIGLAQVAFEADTPVARDASELAVPIALTLVGVPLFWGLAVWTNRRLEEPAEQDATGWLLYLTVTLIFALVAGMMALAAGFTWLVGGDGDAAALASAFVWIVIWGSHWWAGVRYPPLDDLRFQRLAGSAIALWTSAAAAMALISTLLIDLYDAAYRTTLVTTSTDDVRRLAPIVVVGAAVWWWYWLRHAIRDKRTTLWHAYVLLGGVLPGLVITLVAAGFAIFAVLEWGLGTPEGSTADHFSVLPTAFAAAALGLSVFAYHRSLIRGLRIAARSEVDRVYEYLLAATGLITSGVGVAMLIVALIQAIVPSAVAEAGTTGGDVLLLGVTLLILGLPVWASSWLRVQRRVRHAPEEVASPTRRVYLFGLFGIGGLTAAINLIVALAIAIEDLLEETAGWETLFAIRVPLALMLTVGAIAGYHWLVFREDRLQVGKEVPAAPRPHIRSVVVVGSDAPELHKALTDATHARIQTWQRLDDGHPTVDVDAVTAKVMAVDAESVMVVVEPDGRTDVFPVALQR